MSLTLSLFLLLRLLRQVSWPEIRHHPWRNLAALLAVTLGVALAFSVQLINQSALSEFSAAVRAVNGVPDFELRGPPSGFDETLYERVARHPQIETASPVVELDAYGLTAQGKRVALKVVGLDALVAAAVSPALMPQLAVKSTPTNAPKNAPKNAPERASGNGSSSASAPNRMAVLNPDVVFLNAQARQQLTGTTLQLQTPTDAKTTQILEIAGSVAAQGAALAVMDIAGAQAHLGWLGKLSRIDVRLRAGANQASVVRELALPAGVRAAAPDEAVQRVSNVSRAYRVNLTVLALVALFTGAFLVFSILSLSVAKRQAQLALLGVLGLAARERLALVLAESALLGAVGSVLGLALGTGLAAAALQLLAGDLGGGYFPGVTPRLQLDASAATVYGALGVAAAMVGGWLPARTAERLMPALALKGLSASSHASSTWFGPALLLASLALALLPPVGGIALAAYLSVACLLLGGIACVPMGVGALLKWVAPPRHALALLVVERARHQRHTATIAVAGVVASLSLAVALTVMVGSFRASMTQWLDTVLPADLYARAAASNTASSNEGLTLPPDMPRRMAQISGVQRVESLRVVALPWRIDQPAVALIARPINSPEKSLPLVGDLLPAHSSLPAVYVSEAMVNLYGAAPGSTLQLPLQNLLQVEAGAISANATVTVFVRGVWRDYARQHGAVVMNTADYQRLTGDTRINDLAVWLQPGTELGTVQQALRTLATALQFDNKLLQLASPGDIRALSLRIFDRSFAVTYWLQAVAIAIGLFGIAASFSAQVLARRKEFGLLAHLGLTRKQVLTVVAAEGAVWTLVGTLLGLLLGLAVSVVLVKVVNPQSFHWSMDWVVPWQRLMLLCLAVMLAGTLTAWLAARGAAGKQMAQAVKEDW
jgi:putative ABC transport system permease protein